MRSIVKQEYANFLRKLVYSVENIDWSENRSAQMMKLLHHLEKRYDKWPEEVKTEHQKTEKLIESFQNGEISDTELSDKLIELIKSLK
mgnify:FL=1